MQTVGRDNENSEKESAYWTDRYKVRMRHTSPAGVFANAEPKPDIPAFLENCTESILTTGELSVIASLVCWALLDNRKVASRSASNFVHYLIAQYAKGSQI